MIHLSSTETELLVQLKEKCFQASLGTPSKSAFTGIYHMLEKLIREASEQSLSERDNNCSMPLNDLRAEIEAGIQNLQAQLNAMVLA